MFEIKQDFESTFHISAMNPYLPEKMKAIASTMDVGTHSLAPLPLTLTTNRYVSEPIISFGKQDSEKQKKDKVDRFKLFLFVKVLLHVIEQSGNTRLYKQTKLAISACIRQSRKWNNSGTPSLSTILKHVLKDLLVGSDCWQKACRYTKQYYSYY